MNKNRPSDVLPTLALFLCFVTPTSMFAQSQTPLSLDQIRSLISIGAPDATVAHEIQVRGLAFTPSRELLVQLQNARAGSKTIAALRDFTPMLDEAKKQVPTLLTTIYSALDQGSPSSARASISTDLFNNAIKLDTICKPFTYRAHYIEAFFERPQRRFEARVHALFKPMEERVYILWFVPWGDSFQLQDISEPDNEWFQSQITGAQELVRKFIYAVNAGRFDVARQCLVSSLAPRLESSQPILQIRKTANANVSPGQSNISYYKGLKIRVTFGVSQEHAIFSSYYTFLVDQVDGDSKIVAWTTANQSSNYAAEAPGLESATLKRFGIQAQPSAETGMMNHGSAADAAGYPAASSEFTVNHRHKVLAFGPGSNSEFFCQGVLTIGTDNVQYKCTQPDSRTHRCENAIMSPIRDVQLRNGTLRVSGRGFGNAGDLKNAYDALNAFLKGARE